MIYIDDFIQQRCTDRVVSPLTCSIAKDGYSRNSGKSPVLRPPGMKAETFALITFKERMGYT